jgi:hypothetical protein
MKQLFCVVVTDPDYVVGLDSPIIFHVECETQEEAEGVVLEKLSSEEYENGYDQQGHIEGYDPEDVECLDIFSFPVTDLDIIKL